MDRILEELNGFGKYQKFTLIVISTMSILNAMVTFASVFVAAEPKLKCKYKDEYKDNSSDTFNETFVCNALSNLRQSAQLNLSSPYQCDWDNQFYGKTIVNEWDLICDRLFLVNLSQTIFMIGSAVSFFVGYLSDKFGRKPVGLTTTLMMSVCVLINEISQLEAFGLSITTKYTVYAVTQFLIGFSSSITYYSYSILLIEITSSKHITTVSNIYDSLFALGKVILLTVAYFTKNFHYINFFIGGSSLLIFFILALFIPESPSFLLDSKKYSKAYALLQRIAKVNKTEENLLSYQSFLDEFSSESIEVGNQNLEESSKPANKKKYKSAASYLMNPISNLAKTILLTYIFIATQLIYYGVSLGFTSIDSNLDPYLMFFLSAISEFVGYICCNLNDRFSRKNVLIGFLGTASLCCSIVAFIPINDQQILTVNSYMVMVFASIGIAMAAASCNSAYVFASKLYPSSVRNTFVSIITSVGAIGSLVSPEINLLQTLVWSPMPYIVFSASSLVACLFTFFLPNTFNDIYDEI